MFLKAIDKLINRKNASNAIMEALEVGYTSEVIDTLIHEDGSREVLNHGHNVMRDDFLLCMAQCLVNANAKLTQWAIGTGLDDGWDATSGRITLMFGSWANVKSAFNGFSLYWSDTLAGLNTATPVSFTFSTYNTIDDFRNAVIANSDLNEKFRLSYANGDNNELYLTFDAWEVGRKYYKIVRTLSNNTTQTITSTSGDYTNGWSGNLDKFDCSVFSEGTDAIDAPSPTGTALLHEVYRKNIGSLVADDSDGIKFLDNNYQPTASITKIIEIKLTFGNNEGLINKGTTANPVYENTPWREFAIVGGTSGGNAVEFYINSKRHPTIWKTVNEQGSGNMIVERRIRFNFSRPQNS